MHKNDSYIRTSFDQNLVDLLDKKSLIKILPNLFSSNNLMNTFFQTYHHPHQFWNKRTYLKLELQMPFNKSYLSTKVRPFFKGKENDENRADH